MAEDKSLPRKQRAMQAAVDRLSIPDASASDETAQTTPKDEPDPKPSEPQPFPIVAIGASAGGLSALEKFFKELPAEPGMAFVVVQHLDPTHKSLLPELIGKFAKLEVNEIDDQMPVAIDNVYVIPPDRDLGILHGILQLLPPKEPRGLRHPIDFFFRSLAQDRGDRAACIVLSGTGTEGTLGLKAVKGEGGMVIVQDPDTADYDGMPRSAVSTHLADFVLPPDQMPELLIGYFHGAHDRRRRLGGKEGAEPEEGLSKVFVLIRAQTGQDLSFYKKNTVLRRIERRLAVHNIDSLDDYVLYLRKNPGEVDALFNELLIGVTNFFRDSDAFSALESMVIPALIKSKKPGETIRIWVPGCSTGEEAYSIALLLENELSSRNEDRGAQIFATDLDSNAINVGRQGLYPESISVDVPEKYVKKYFTKSDSTLQIKRNIRDMLIFAEQNVVKDPPFSKLDLISCRNLLIYMEPEWQAKVISLFHYALKPGGYLFLGSSETVGRHTQIFSTVDRKAKIFRSEDLGRARVPGFDMSMPVTGARQRLQSIDAAKPGKPLGYRELIGNLLLADYSPACVLVDKAGEILFVHGRTGNYLEPPSGIASLNIEAMAREGLRIQLSTAIRKAFSKHQEVCYEGVKVKSDDTIREINLIVRPILEPPEFRGLAIIVFHDVASHEADEVCSDAGLSDESQHRIAELERELRTTNEYLQTTVEELETSNEELKSTNEELQSANEELQSTNEELETSKEELQSINEELITLNAELEKKIEELGKTNDDMTNLLTSTEIGTIFLDGELNVARFTPAVANAIHIVAADVGRPISHIASNIDYPDLVDDVRQVLATLIPQEREARSKDGRWYSVRINPYRTTANVISGVVVTFVDISERKLLEAQSRLAAVVRDSNDAVTVQDLEGTILAWNRGAAHMYGFSENEALGMNISSTFSEGENREMLRLMPRVIRGEIVEPFATRRKSRDGRLLDVLLTVTLLRDEEGRPQAVATTERDITDQGKEHRHLLQMSQLFRDAFDPIVIEDMDGLVIDVNTEAVLRYGWPREALVGQAAEVLTPLEHRDHVRALLQRSKQGEDVRNIQGTRQHSSGAVIPVRITLSRMIDEYGEITGIATIARQPDVENDGSF